MLVRILPQAETAIDDDDDDDDDDDIKGRRKEGSVYQREAFIVIAVWKGEVFIRDRC